METPATERVELEPVPSDHPALDLIAEHRGTLHMLHLTVDIRDHVDWRDSELCGAFIQELYGTDDPRELWERSGEARESEGLSDVLIWRELYKQRTLTANGNGRGLPGIERMSVPARLVGAALAAETIYGYMSFPERHEPEDALRRLETICGLDRPVTERLIRIVAERPYQSSHIGISGYLLLEAVRRPDGITRRAVNDADGRIDLELFRDPDIVEQTAREAFRRLVIYRPHERTRLSERDYARLKREFPGQVGVLEQDPDFQQEARELIEERIRRYMEDPAAEPHGTLLPPARAFSVVPLRTCLAAAERLRRETAPEDPLARGLQRLEVAIAKERP